MSPVFSCCRSDFSVYPSFSEVSECARITWIRDRDQLMRVLSATSVATHHRALLRRSYSPLVLACKYRLHIRHNSTLVMPEASPKHQSSIEVPPGFTLHSENTTHILLPSDNGAFLNPVQEFNRDLSVACIQVWSEEWNRTKEVRWRAAQEKKAKKPEKRLKGLFDIRIPFLAVCDWVPGCYRRFEKPGGANRTEGKRSVFLVQHLSSNLDSNLSSSFVRRSSYC